MRLKRKLSRRVSHIACCLSCIVLFSSCAKDLALEDFGKLSKGMTRQEVESVLGAGEEVTWAEVAPRLAKTGGSELSETSCDTWLQWGNRKGLGFAGFKDGRVTELFFD
jgi:hypothetical protein